MRIVFFGSPGSGKGTQAAELAKAYSLIHVSTGEIFRAKVLDGTRIGKRIGDTIAAGSLVDDITTNYVLFKAIEGLNRFLVDGYPRNIAQARSFDVHLKNIQSELTCALFLDVPMEVAEKRLMLRRSQRYDKIENYRRADDAPAVIHHRFDVYRRETEPLIQYYSDRIIRVDGTGSPAEVTHKIVKALQQWA
ncbi:MAG: nucleoside monophosphate kinase [Candidatus Fermentibacteraceae bacterium]|nr:nucleoside monophosphate kinase [Candidatus Fermentibacteraceae bacterium]